MRCVVGDADDSFAMTVDSCLVSGTGLYVHAIDWPGTVEVGDRLLVRKDDRPVGEAEADAVETGGFRVADRTPVLGLRLWGVEEVAVGMRLTLKSRGGLFVPP
jgi:hypothetical protein